MDFCTLPGSLASLQRLLESDEKENSKSSCHLENKQPTSWWGKLPRSVKKKKKKWPGKPRFTEITRKLMASWSLATLSIARQYIEILFIPVRRKGSQVCPVLVMYQVPGERNNWVTFYKRRKALKLNCFECLLSARDCHAHTNGTTHRVVLLIWCLACTDKDFQLETWISLSASQFTEICRNLAFS